MRAPWWTFLRRVSRGEFVIDDIGNNHLLDPPASLRGYDELWGQLCDYTIMTSPFSFPSMGRSRPRSGDFVAAFPDFKTLYCQSVLRFLFILRVAKSCI